MKLKSDTQCRYTPDAGEYDPQEKIYCGVCGDVMDARLGVDGPTSWAEGVSGRTHLHDSYECPNMKEKEVWHLQVIALRNEKRRTASTLIEAILEEEIGMVLETRKETKKIGPLHGRMG